MNKQGTCPHKECCRPLPARIGRTRMRSNNIGTHLCICNPKLWRVLNETLSRGTFPQAEGRLILQLKNPAFSTRQHLPRRWSAVLLSKTAERQRKHLDMRHVPLWSSFLITPLQFLPGKMRFCPHFLSRNGFCNLQQPDACLVVEMLSFNPAEERSNFDF